MNKALHKAFQVCSQQYFISLYQNNKFLYFDLLPHSYFGTDYKTEIFNCKFTWLNNSEMKVDTYKIMDRHHGKKECTFIEDCKISYRLKINSIEIPGIQNQVIKFLAKSFEPYGINISVSIIIKALELINDFRKIKSEIQKKFKIITISEKEFTNKRIGFAYYTEVIGKERKNIFSNDELGHGNIYQEIANCHDEIKECLLNTLFHQKYLNDMLGQKVKFEKETLFLPNLSYNDFQYLIWISFGLDRLYSFWDRITFVLANYESLSLKISQVSFDTYFEKLNKKINNNNPIIFNVKSKNLKWLIEFHKNEYPNFTNYRHRIVHYQITPKWEGVLSSMFSSNAMENITKESELKKLKNEFEGLGNLLLKQFNYCIEGFVRTLDLIEELEVT